MQLSATVKEPSPMPKSKSRKKKPPKRVLALPDLEQRGYAPATINLRLAAVRRIAYEAADAGLLSPELAAGIRRVKGVRRIGVRLGNWLTPQQGRRLLNCAPPATARQLRDHAMIAMLIGCGLRRAELLSLRLELIQQREDHWVIADLVGKGGHVRTVCRFLPG